MVGNIRGTWWNRNIFGNLFLKSFQYKLLERIGLLGAESLVGVMRELLRLKADARVKLHFKSLAAIRLDPLAINALVLLSGPGILDFVQLETLVLETGDVRPRAIPRSLTEATWLR